MARAYQDLIQHISGVLSFETQRRKHITSNYHHHAGQMRSAISITIWTKIIAREWVLPFASHKLGQETVIPECDLHEGDARGELVPNFQRGHLGKRGRVEDSHESRR